ncbi:MAG: AraC family transcriptional regulator [Haliscomenobacter sp.]|uniref:helix-turn-helix domain-containing protein n=1 Tax=Haliscomenobacter sp. TaxID=2717303 RepID=UPI0029A02FEE|nr:AraC family transcriptional regulator [Haliscomenobacter sp.]MDX2068726.1 AraC family transcriptional regulator [Haliscomenobacter sp.]
MLINAISASSFFYLAFVLLVKGRTTNRLANRWLAAFVIFVGFLQLDDALIISGTYFQYPHFYNVFDPFLFGIAPAFYWAAFHFVQPSRRFYWQSLWHFIPAYLILLLSIPAFLESKAEKLAFLKVLKEKETVLEPVEMVVFALIFVQCVVYMVLSYRRILQHQQNLKKVSSTQDGTDLQWFNYFLKGVALLLLFWGIEIIFYTNFLDGRMSLIYWLGSFYLGFYAIQQKEIYPFAPQELVEIEAIIQEQPLAHSGASSVDEAQRKQLLSLMEREKPHLDSELSLPKLAKLMGCSTHELSHLINQGFERNFYQFINNYRIEESKKLLSDPKMEHLTILAIGFEAGFNSKTTFNTTFKQLVGMSPVEFRKSKTMA